MLRNIRISAVALTLLGLVVSSSLVALAAEADKTPATGKKAGPPKIQVAILLDTSNSMDGLIGQAKAQLWKIVNEYASSTQYGKAPELEVALYEYGNDNLAKKDGYVRLVSKLTDNLDLISEELFKLKTNGGQEYCGTVVERAVNDLAWSDDGAALKCIFIAGNEPFTQGPVDYKKACKAAIAKDVTVNTIFCGTHQTGLTTGWRDGAVLADGSFVSINQNEKIVHVAAPHDTKIVRLNVELNKTYVAYGNAKDRKMAKDRQEAQDKNAAGVSGANLAQRAQFKAKGQYNSANWDLIDACKKGKVKLEDLAEDQLPEELRKMTVEQRTAFITAKAAERKKLQEQISELGKQRDAFVAKERKRLAETTGNTLDEAMITAVRAQAAKKSFVFEE